MRPGHHPRLLPPLILAAILLLTLSRPALASTYVSWDRFEADKLAAAWLIKRFVDPDAVFRFLPAGSPLPEGVPFDVPQAELRRTVRQTTFAAILARHALKDPVLARLATFISDLEINLWGEKQYRESVEIQDFVLSQIDVADHAVLIDNTLAFFDILYDRLGAAPSGTGERRRNPAGKD
ncbi:MAG: chromate resistance protein ChrB domain-containing protein [Thermodesulfobacteriota bacterium]